MAERIRLLNMRIEKKLDKIILMREREELVKNHFESINTLHRTLKNLDEQTDQVTQCSLQQL